MTYFRAQFDSFSVNGCYIAEIELYDDNMRRLTPQNGQTSLDSATFTNLTDGNLNTYHQFRDNWSGTFWFNDGAPVVFARIHNGRGSDYSYYQAEYIHIYQDEVNPPATLIGTINANREWGWFEYVLDGTVQTLDITEDAMTISGGNSSINYATGVALTAGFNGSNGLYYRSHIGIPQFTLGENEEVTKVELLLTRSFAREGGFPTEIHTADAAWDESTITWDNQPTSTYQAEYADPGGAEGESVVLDITDFYDVGHGIVLVRTINGYLTVGSSENTTVAYRPKLRVYAKTASTSTPIRSWGIPVNEHVGHWVVAL